MDDMGLDMQLVMPPPPQCYFTVPVDVADGVERCIARARAVVTLRVLAPRAQELQVLVEDVLDPEEHVAEPRLLHQRARSLGRKLW